MPANKMNFKLTRDKIFQLTLSSQTLLKCEESKKVCSDVMLISSRIWTSKPILTNLKQEKNDDSKTSILVLGCEDLQHQEEDKRFYCTEFLIPWEKQVIRWPLRQKQAGFSPTCKNLGSPNVSLNCPPCCLKQVWFHSWLVRPDWRKISEAI